MAWTSPSLLTRTAIASALVSLALVLVGCGSAAPAAAVAAPTPTATALPTSTATPKATFADPLSANTNGWPTDPGHCEFANAGMQISDAVCALPFFDAEDGALSVSAMATAGDPGNGFGLVWRAGGESAYEFGIAANGTWGFEKVDSGVATALDTGENTAIRQGLNVANSIRVSFRGSHYTFYVNDVMVGESDDSSLASGVIGMFAYQGGTAVFNNLAYFE